MISDLDGATLRGYASQHGGQATIRVSSDIREIQTGRSGVITSFSSAGPTDFGWFLKPDISAPGLDVLSSTPPLTTGSTFSVFAGTSMATPHVAGAAALLVQRHPTWTPAQIKSALMSTAGAAWQDTARTQEASVLLEGAGLTNVQAADDPKVFTDPQSLSFQRLDVSTGAQRKSLLLSLTDAGGGARHLERRGQAAGADDRCADRRAEHRHARPGRPRVRAGHRHRGCRRRPPATNDGFVVLSGQRRAAPCPVRVPRRAPGASQRAVDAAQGDRDRRHAQRARARSRSTAARPSRSGRRRLHRRADERGRLRDAVLVRGEPADRQLRRLRPRRVRRLADRSVHPRLEGRERRAGLRGDPDGRELA